VTPRSIRVKAGTLLATFGPADPLVAVNGNKAPPEPGGGGLQGLKLVLHGLAAICGADPDVERSAIGGSDVGNANRLSRIWVNKNGCLGNARTTGQEWPKTLG
jgi:hypothetical protein